MAITFAKNLSLVCIGIGPVVVYTDPIPLGGNDRLSCICNVHYLQSNSAAGVGQVAYTALFSNDGGVTYVASSTVLDTLYAAGVSQIVGPANAAYVRFQFALSNPLAGATDVSSVNLDLHVNADKA